MARTRLGKGTLQPQRSIKFFYEHNGHLNLEERSSNLYLQELEAINWLTG